MDGPATWGVWVPARIEHSIRFRGRSAQRTAYVRPDRYADVPDACTALTVSSLLRELLVRATAIGALDRRTRSEAAIADLIVGELAVAGRPPFALPEPASSTITQAARLLVDGPLRGAGTVDLAGAVGVGTRTLERRFREETGVSIGAWRRQRMLLDGLELIASGGSIKHAARTAGYRSPSAFIAAFGSTPGRYFPPVDEHRHETPSPGGSTDNWSRSP